MQPFLTASFDLKYYLLEGTLLFTADTLGSLLHKKDFKDNLLISLIIQDGKRSPTSQQSSQ